MLSFSMSLYLKRRAIFFDFSLGDTCSLREDVRAARYVFDNKPLLLLVRAAVSIDAWTAQPQPVLLATWREDILEIELGSRRCYEL